MRTVIRRSDFDRYFKNSSVKVSDLREEARAAGLSNATVRAFAAADLDGDGKISGEAEGRALFKAADRLDHDGSRLSIQLDTRWNTLLNGVEKRAAPTSGWQPRVVSGRLACGDTLSPVTDRSSTLINSQRLNRRYTGSGPVSLAMRGNQVAAAQFTGGMQVDTDGGKSALARSDRYYQSQTSMKWAGRRSLNADTLPFVVLPPSMVTATGAKLGDLVQVTKNGKTLYAIFGDVGPGMKLGEGSLMLARSFDGRAGPNRGIDGGVTYTVLPGSGARQGIRNGGPEKSAMEIQRAGAAEFARARAQRIVG